jgi:hypothetical protein
MLLGATASTTATDAARGVNKKMLHMGSDLRLVRESGNTWDRVSMYGKVLGIGYTGQMKRIRWCSSRLATETSQLFMSQLQKKRFFFFSFS